MATNTPFYGIKVSKPGVPVQQATDKELVLKDDFTSRIWYDNSNARIIEGQLPDGTYGMWVSQPGFDVTIPTASTDNQLIFNSNDKFFNVIAEGTSSVTLPNPPVAGHVYTTTLAHGLSFAPAYDSYLTSVDQSGGITTVGNWKLPVTGADGVLVYMTSDATNLYFNAVSASGSGFDSGIINIQYYLLRLSSA